MNQDRYYSSNLKYIIVQSKWQFSELGDGISVDENLDGFTWNGLIITIFRYLLRVRCVSAFLSVLLVSRLGLKSLSLEMLARTTKSFRSISHFSL